MNPKLLNRQAKLTMRERVALLHQLMGYLGDSAEFCAAMESCLDSIEAVHRPTINPIRRRGAGGALPVKPVIPWPLPPITVEHGTAKVKA